MKLIDLLKSVTEKNLSKQQLEDYHTELTGLYAQMMWELSDLEKQEAVYFLEYKEMAEDKVTDVEIKRKWRGTPGGLRLIELKNYEKAVTKVLVSIKNRMYASY